MNKMYKRKKLCIGLPQQPKPTTTPGQTRATLFKSKAPPTDPDISTHPI